LCAAQNNCYSRHLAKILIHLSWCLQECVSNSAAPSEVYAKAVNAVHISSVFLKYLIENAQSNNSIEELYLSLNVSEPAPNDFNTGISLHVRIKTSKILSCIVYFCSMLCWSKVHHGFLTMLTMLRFCAIWSSKMRYFCSKFKHIPSGFYITSCSISCLL
jgi:hypothetical protein